MPIKALRMQIIKPYNEPDDPAPVTWDTLGQTLRDLRYAASKMANYVIQQNYMWEFFRQKYKAENGIYPLQAEHRDRQYCYPALTKMFPAAAAQLINQIEQHAKKVWGARKAEILKLHQSVPSFKLNFPILVHRKCYSIRCPEEPASNKFIIQANLTSKASGRTNYSFLVDAGERSKRTIVERLISGQYRQGALQIVAGRTGKWFCLIPYEFHVEVDDKLDPNRIMGVCFGVSKAVYWAFSDSWKRGWIDGGEVDEFRRRVQARYKSIRQQNQCPGEGRIGHGRNRRLLPILGFREKEANFRTTTNHRYAKRIVEEAVRNKCGVIQMEDIAGINEQGVFLKNWTYFDLQTKIKDKAAEAGIKIRIIDQQYISRRCSQCGSIDSFKLQDQATFVCQSCGFGELYRCLSCGKSQQKSGLCANCNGSTRHVPIVSDYNTARNIAAPASATTVAESLLAESIVSKTNNDKPKRTPKTQ